MNKRGLQLVLLTIFAVAVGDFAFRTHHPATTPEYIVEGVIRPITLAKADPLSRHLYLRRNCYLTQPPERAWIQVLGHDRVEVFVNGRNVGRSSFVGNRRIASWLTDITRFLHVGRNSIAIHAPQLVLNRPAAIAFAGECEFADGKVQSLAEPFGDWRATDHYDRRGPFWYESEFEDKHWEVPRLGPEEYWRAQVAVPPRAVTRPRRSQWVVHAATTDSDVAVARSFLLPGGPRDGWLRVLATGPYRVAVNGYLIADDHDELAVERPYVAVEKTFDISPLLKAGANNVSIMVTTAGEPPRVRADLEATAANGRRVYIATNNEWKSAAGLASDWQSPHLDDRQWQPCRAEVGYVGVTPRSVVREPTEINPPVAFWFARASAYVGWILLTGLIAAVGCSAVLWLLNCIGRGCSDTLPRALPFLALLPSSVAAAAAGLMTWDLAWVPDDFYQPRWLFGLWLLVAGQWVLLTGITALRSTLPAAISLPNALPRRLLPSRVFVTLSWLLIIGTALWLRVRDISAEPIHHDEVTAYAFTMSVFELGFPGGQVHPDLPFGYVATNELAYYPTALCGLFVDDPRLMLRIPSVVWSMATLLLLAYVGWRWFDPYVGFAAAVMYAVSPHVIGMANFGRYLSQMQFFALLTMYLTFEAVRGTGPFNLRALWGAALSFAALYLTWEGTGMFALGLALAVLFHRRRHLRSLLTSPHLYLASALVVLVIVGQNAHRVMQQTQRLWYGEGISSLTIKPMWRYPFFQHDYFLLNSSWLRDAFLPMAALAIAIALAIGHRWRFPLRFSIICLLVNAELMAAFLPVRTNRYSYHLTVILVLVAAAALVACAQAILRSVRGSQPSILVRWYVRCVAGGVTAVGLLFMSGWFVRLSEMTSYANSAFDVRQLHVPDWEGPTRFLKVHLREGDVVIALFPHTQNFMFITEKIGKPDPRTVDYWLESRLVLQATIGDTRNVPLDRRSGAVMLYNLDQVEKLFSTHDRIWYCTMRFSQSKINDSIVSKYLRQHMDIVCEGFGTALMLRDKNHRPAPIRLEEQEAGQIASDFYLR